MSLIEVAILSIIEGLTEFLPISSTAHLILTSHILGVPKTTFLSTFEVAIQLGAILAVVVFYFNKLKSKANLLNKSLIGFIPTGILGFLFYDYIKMFLNDPFVPVVALFLGGLAMIGIEMLFKNKSSANKHKPLNQFNTRTISNLSYKDAFLIGLIQSISMIPGVSRAAASIFGAMALKFDRKSSVEFSFLLAIPTILAATFFDLSENITSFTSQQIFHLILGIVLSFVSALIVIKWLIKFVQKNDFVWFGVYRIVLSVVYYLIFLR